MSNPAVAPVAQGTARSSRREKSYLAGKIVTATGSFDCVIRDRSPDGARIRVLLVPDVPAEFHLIDVRAGLAHQARVVWAHRPWMGVKFEQTWELQSGCPPALTSPQTAAAFGRGRSAPRR